MNMAAISLGYGFSRFGFSFLSLFCILLLQSATGRQLKFVVLVMRHGDRTPTSTYPTDPYKENIWPEGFGQLTRRGIQQQFQLGLFLRKRYQRFLSSTYSRKEIYVRSTDVDRTIMSAQANLAGLFIPTGRQLWSHSIRWQPIPVHTVPRKDDKLLSFPIYNCPRFKTLLKQTMQQEEVQNKIKSSMRLFATLAKYTGYDVKTLLDLNSQKLYEVFDALYVQKIYGRRLPQWATSDLLQQMGQVLAYGLTAIFGVYKREDKSRMQGGLLVKDILEKMKEVAQSGAKTKMIMYSAHDTTLVALMMALNVFNGKTPRYASCFMFELYKESNGEYSVSMNFRNGQEGQPTPVHLQGCSPVCTPEKFEKLMLPNIPNDWNEECLDQS